MTNKVIISVIVCTYNRDKFIKACLTHLYNQALAKENYEVIVVNNNCTDNTKAIVDAFIAEHSELNIRQVIESNQGLSFARNRGIKEAQSELIAYIDDDGEAKEDWLSNIVSIMDSNPNYAGIGGRVLPQYETKEPKWLTYHLRMMVTHIDYGDKIFKCFGKRYPPGCNMIYRKAILEKVGGFNDLLKWRVDDKYIYQEVAKVNDEVYYRPELKVNHNIDAYRVSDASFDTLSKRLGEEEKIRIKDISYFSYLIKIIEYIIKYFASIILALKFVLQGKTTTGKYLIRFRRLALIGLIK